MAEGERAYVEGGERADVGGGVEEERENSSELF